MVGPSPSHVNAVFRQQTGTGPLHHQVLLRMARARELLDTADLTVAAVGRAAGYADPLYFSRQSSPVQGESPTAYRERHHPWRAADPAPSVWPGARPGGQVSRSCEGRNRSGKFWYVMG